MLRLEATASPREQVVLLDNCGAPIGCAPKEDIHHSDTPLHLAFSLFIFDEENRFLAQRRSFAKKTWPGVWSNSCCGHPAPGESPEDAIRRRARYEIGLELGELTLVLPDFRYRACWQGLWENELCPVWIAKSPSSPPRPNPLEVAETAWVSWPRFLAASHLLSHGEFAHFSPWSLLEARQLGNAAQIHLFNTSSSTRDSRTICPSKI